jgi:hypothetical protein
MSHTSEPVGGGATVIGLFRDSRAAERAIRVRGDNHWDRWDLSVTGLRGRNLIDAAPRYAA